MAPTRDVTNVLVGISWLYLAPGDTAMVADSVAYGGTWTAPWTYVGATEEGVSQSFERDINFHRIEEQSSPVAVTVNESTISISTNLAEHTLENMKTSFGGGEIVTTAAGTGQIGKKTLTLSDELDFLAVGLEGKNPEGFFRRLYIPRVVSVASVETAHRRSETKKLLPVTLQAVCDISEIEIVDMTAVASA
jgi:hypothetical protein